MFKALAGMILLAVGLAAPLPTCGEMTSANYTIYADAISSGGLWSTSTIYSLQDTVGESPAGFVTSTSYELRGGYQAMVSSTLGITFSTTLVQLGSLSATQVTSGSTIVTINTTSDGGYTLSISGVSGNSLPAVADGAVSIGVEEYGFSASGGDSQLTGDVAVTNGLVIASASTVVTDSQITLAFKASVKTDTVEQVYTQNITLTAVTNLNL